MLALTAAYDVYVEVSQKAEEGLKFYSSLFSIVKSLTGAVEAIEAACKVSFVVFFSNDSEQYFTTIQIIVCPVISLKKYHIFEIKLELLVFLMRRLLVFSCQ